MARGVLLVAHQSQSHERLHGVERIEGDVHKPSFLIDVEIGLIGQKRDLQPLWFCARFRGRHGDDAYGCGTFIRWRRRGGGRC